MADGVNVSKAQVYAVISPPKGVLISKVVSYAVIQPLDPGVDVSKALVYAVIHEVPTASFKPYWIPKRSQIIGGGIN
jgi:hypothetical protein